MTLAAKKRILVAAPLFVALWPLAHYALVRRFDLEPWKFFGWAMYCRPRNQISIYVLKPEGDGWRPMSGAELSPSLIEAIHKYQVARSYYGVLAQPSGIAGLILAEQPELTDVMIAVENLKIDSGTGLFEPDRRTVRYSRAPGPGP